MATTKKKATKATKKPVAKKKTTTAKKACKTTKKTSPKKTDSTKKQNKGFLDWLFGTRN